MGRCQILSCRTHSKAGQLMCRAHWFALPKPLRAAIGDSWRRRDMAAYRANVGEAVKFITGEG